jgi:hypothetical protein
MTKTEHEMKHIVNLMKLATVISLSLFVMACGTESDSDEPSSDAKVIQQDKESVEPREGLETADANASGTDAASRQSQIESLVQQARNPGLGNDQGAIERLVETARSLNGQGQGQGFGSFFGNSFGTQPNSQAQNANIQDIIRNALEIDRSGANSQNIDNIIRSGQQYQQGQTQGQSQPQTPNQSYNWQQWLPQR